MHGDIFATLLHRRPPCLGLDIDRQLGLHPDHACLQLLLEVQVAALEGVALPGRTTAAAGPAREGVPNTCNHIDASSPATLPIIETRKKQSPSPWDDAKPHQL